MINKLFKRLRISAIRFVMNKKIIVSGKTLEESEYTRNFNYKNRILHNGFVTKQNKLIMILDYSISCFTSRAKQEISCF